MDAVLELAEARGLDFVVLTEHNTVSHDDFINAVQARHPKVLLIPGIEVTTYDGHMGAINATQFVEHKIGLDGATIGQSAAAIHDQGALLSINHPTFELGDLCIGCAWHHELPDDAVDAMEIVSAGSATLFVESTLALWETYLARGAHLAALGGSDDHRAGVNLGPLQTPIGSPTTMVYARELSAAAIAEGVRLGRTVVKVDGPEAPMVDLSTDPPLAGDGVAAATVKVHATVTGGSGQLLRLVADGQVATEVVIEGDPFTFDHEVTPGEATTFLRAETELAANRTTITSHIWLSTGPSVDAELTGGGCACEMATTGRLGPSAAMLLFALLIARRRQGSGNGARVE
jgi:hypothetical protein